MRRVGLLAAAVLLGALVVSGQEEEGRSALSREIERLRALLEERVEARMPAAEESLVTRIYEVEDLAAGIRDRAQPLENLQPSKLEVLDCDDADSWAHFEIDALCEMIRFGVEPASWDILAGVEIQPRHHKLVITTLPRIHGKIERLLAWCRESMDRRVAVQVAFVPVQTDDRVPLGGMPQALDETRARALLARPRLGTVTLVGWDGQLMGDRVGREVSYLRDYEVEVASKSARGDPIRATAFSGCSAEVRACLDDGGGAVLHCQLEFSRIPEDFPTHPTEHGDIELPVKKLTRLQLSFRAPLGRTVVAGGCTVGEGPCLILVTARRS